MSTGNPSDERISAKIGSACCKPDAARGRSAGAVGLVERGLVDEADLQAAPRSPSARTATSSACARLSSWHGPAMIEIGRSLPNLTDPAATTGAAEIVGVQRLLSCRYAVRARDHAGVSTFPIARSTLRFRGLEYQGCAIGDIRRHDQPPDMALRGNSALAEQASRPARCRRPQSAAHSSVIPSPLDLRRIYRTDRGTPTGSMISISPFSVRALTPIELECRSLTPVKAFRKM